MAAVGLWYVIDMTTTTTTNQDWETSRKWLGLPLTIDEAIARYLRWVADGPECASYLRRVGFERWMLNFKSSHARYRAEGGFNEWDTHDYTDAELRATYDGIIMHSSRKSGTA